jgi:hypothetical protein
LRSAAAGILTGAAAAVSGRVADVAAACARAGQRCASDGACCSGLICVQRSCRQGCRIDGKVYRAGTRNPANPCEGCRPGKSTTAWSPLNDGVSCNDGNRCTSGTVCQSGVCSGGAQKDCSSLDNVCATGVCDPATGRCQKQVHDGLPCVASSTSDPETCTVGQCDATGTCAGVTTGLDKACGPGGTCCSGQGCIESPAGSACKDCASLLGRPCGPFSNAGCCGNQTCTCISEPADIYCTGQGEGTVGEWVCKSNVP